MFAQPVRELEDLRGRKHHVSNRIVKPGENPLADLAGDLFDIRADVEIKDAGGFAFNIRDVPVSYDAKKQTLTCKQVTAPLSPMDGKIQLRLLVDRGSIELFGNDGRLAVSVGIAPDDGNRSLSLSARGGAIRLRELDVDELSSAWANAKD